CDGQIIPRRCASCWSESCGAPKSLAQVLGMLPPQSEAVLERIASLNGRAATALSARANAERFKISFADMIMHADYVVAVCQWLFDSLLLNGVPKEKLILSRQGVETSFVQEITDDAAIRKGDGTFRLLYLGRWDRVKGIDVLVKALRRVPAHYP